MHFLQGAVINEYNKKKNRSLIMLYVIGGLAIVILLMQIINSFTPFLPNKTIAQDWRVQLTQEADQLQWQLDTPHELNPSEQEAADKRISLIRYQLKSDLSPSPNDAVHSVMNSMKGVFIRLILPLLMIIVGADIFSSEFSTRTLKQLLLRPIGRSRILLSKWIWLTFVSCAILLVVYIFIFALNLKNGIGTWNDPVAVFLKSPDFISGWLYLLIGLIANILVIACYSSFILFISYFIRSLAISSALLIGFFIFSSLILELRHKIPPLRFLFLNHTDLLSHLDATSSSGVSLGISVLILGCTSAFLYLIIWAHFSHSDMNVWREEVKEHESTTTIRFGSAERP